MSLNSVYKFALLEELWNRTAKQTRSPNSQDPCPLIIHHSLENTQGGNGNPLQYSCLENSMDREAWWASPLDHKELGTTEQLTHTHTQEAKISQWQGWGEPMPCPSLRIIPVQGPTSIRLQARGKYQIQLKSLLSASSKEERHSGQGSCPHL